MKWKAKIRHYHSKPVGEKIRPSVFSLFYFAKKGLGRQEVVPFPDQGTPQASKRAYNGTYRYQ